MSCLQNTHKAKTVADLIRISSVEAPIACNGNGNRSGNLGCREKAKELINRIRDEWHPNKETPQRHNLWHSPRRIERNRKADIKKTPVLYNPDTRTTYDLLGGIRIFGKDQGHKSKKRDPYQPAKPPARINSLTAPGLCQVTINTDGSAIKNGWENASAGIGVWYADGSRQNIALKLENHQNYPASNSRAELSAILEALRQNEVDDLIIESDSLSSVRAICRDSVRYKDQGWNGTQNTDLLKHILVRLRTRPAQVEKW